LINKGIFKRYEEKTPPFVFRINNNEIPDHAWYFTNIYVPNLQAIRGGRFPSFNHTVIQDYDDDGVNQILLKFITISNNAFLCGVDYSNSLWCMRLPGFMYKYRIKSVYKVSYELDEKTKIFEF
jgi:hypothetical protein